MIDIPPIYCIWNREIPRRETTEPHFKAMGINATFFEGIYGKGFRVRAAEPTSMQPNGDPWYISQGHIGLCLSHYMVWSHIWHAGHEEAIVLEDDAFFGATFHNDYRDFRRRLPADWDMAYLGWLHSGHDRVMKQVNGRVHTLEGCPFGTHALLIRRSGIRILLDTQRVMMQHIDINIDQLSLPHMKTYVAYPSLVTQRSQNGKTDKPAAFKPSV